jgi:hypothetical protein
VLTLPSISKHPAASLGGRPFGFKFLFKKVLSIPSGWGADPLQGRKPNQLSQWGPLLHLNHPGE